MFTGIIREVGTITAIQLTGETAQIQIQAPATIADAAIGDSICVNGTCLTVSTLDGNTFWADISQETLNRTSFAQTQAGDPVNLEPALRLSDRLGGHLVSGHVDGVGQIETIEGDGEFSVITFRFPSHIAPYIAEKGSICLEGISLTVTFVEDETAGIAVIPTTLRDTTLGIKEPGDTINIEVDVIARYLERLMKNSSIPSNQGLTIEKLRQYGYPIDIEME
jgi:riboflavin synthase